MAEVTLKNIWKSYPGAKGAEHPVVRDVSLEIQPREFVVLVGPSGCGKSTTLRMIAGLEEISRGSIQIGGRLVNDVQPKDRDIAMVFQNYALYPHMSVRDNLGFALKLRGCGKDEIRRRVDAAAAILGIADYLDRKPKALSGGQRQRVALGRAIVRQPSVFLFDEPLSNLDAKMRVQMRSEIVQLHQRLQATMIYVTHDQVEAMTMGQRIVVMNHGVIQQVAPPMEIYDRPANMFVAGFIGTPPMNFLRGRMESEAGDPVFREGGGCVRLPLRSAGADAELPVGEVVLGVRPEHCVPVESATGLPGGFTARITAVETVGAETFLTLDTGAAKVVSRTERRATRDMVGRNADFVIDPARVFLFRPDDGRRIS
jgi:multiple sugar transport system ATP-binding protein